MPMQRAQLTADLWGMLQTQFTEVGIVNDDSTGNLKEPVDQTLLALGTDYDDLPTATVANADVSKALILARYYGLLKVYDAAMNRTDTQKSVGAPSVSRSDNKSQYVRQLENAIFRAKEQAEPFLPSAGANSWGFGTISLDFIEPAEVAL